MSPPPSSPPAVPTARQAWITLGLMLGGWLAALMMFGIVLAVYIMLLRPGSQPSMSLPVIAASVVASMSGLLMPALLMTMVWKLKLRWTFRLWPARFALYPVGMIGILAVGVLANSLLLWLKSLVPALNPKAMTELGKAMQTTNSTYLGGWFLFIVMLPALYEELIFRGFLQRGFETNYRPALAIGLSSLFFGIVHVDPFQGLGAMCLGGYLGFLAWRTGSIFPGVVAHATQNSLFLLINQLPETHTLRELDEQTPIGVLVGAVVVLMISVIAITRLARKSAEPQLAPAQVEALGELWREN